VLAVCIGVFLFTKSDHPDGSVRGLIFTTLVVACIAIIITNRSWTKNLLATLRTPNPAQWWVIFGSIAFLVLALNLPIAQRMFHFAPVHAWEIAVCIVLGNLSVGWIEWVKYLRRSHDARPSTERSTIA
jgi:Ca2+-transporting ATPase